MKKKILFLCTANSCRSQMAEGWGRHLKGDQYEFYSAGTRASHVNPHAIEVMQEKGIDLSTHSSKTVDQIDVTFDLVFTVCSDADENCPIFPGPTRVVHRGFDDPPRLSETVASTEEKMNIYRRVREEIGEFVENIEKWVEA